MHKAKAARGQILPSFYMGEFDMWIWIVKCVGVLGVAAVLTLLLTVTAINEAIKFFKDNY